MTFSIGKKKPCTAHVNWGGGNEWKATHASFFLFFFKAGIYAPYRFLDDQKRSFMFRIPARDGRNSEPPRVCLPAFLLLLSLLLFLFSILVCHSSGAASSLLFIFTFWFGWPPHDKSVAQNINSDSASTPSDLFVHRLSWKWNRGEIWLFFFLRRLERREMSDDIFFPRPTTSRDSSTRSAADVYWFPRVMNASMQIGVGPTACQRRSNARLRNCGGCLFVLFFFILLSGFSRAHLQ